MARPNEAPSDRVRVRLPMTVRAEPLPDDPSLVAFMFGPLVLAGDLGRDGREFEPDEWVDNGKDPSGPRVSGVAAVPPALIAATVFPAKDDPSVEETSTATGARALTVELLFPNWP